MPPRAKPPSRSESAARRRAKRPSRPRVKRGHFEVVLIAASAGGVPVLRDFLSELPATFPVPIAVVLHRSESEPFRLAQVLGRVSKLAVRTAKPGERLEAGTVYLAPPRHHLIIRPDLTLDLMDGHKIKYLHSSANPLFESAAYSLNGRVVAVVLTGSGTDGTNGVQTVKGMGGVVLVQDPATTAYATMPLSAIGTGAVDHVLPLGRIPSELIKLVTRRASE